MAQQTAVEWLVKMLYSPVCKGFINERRRIIPQNVIEDALAMEKEQITDAYIMGSYDMAAKEFRPEQYYNKTYK